MMFFVQAAWKLHASIILIHGTIQSNVFYMTIKRSIYEKKKQHESRGGGGGGGELNSESNVHAHMQCS